MKFIKRFLCHSIIIIFSCTNKISGPGFTDYSETVNRQFWTAAWSPDNNYIAVGGVDSMLRIYHARNLKLYKSFPVDSWIHIVKWHPGGETLAIGTLDKYVYLLNPHSGNIKSLNHKGGTRALDWNYNGELLAVADLEEGINIWNTEGEHVNNIKKTFDPETPGKAYLALDWHPSKNIMVAANFQINLFDADGRTLNKMEHTNKAAIILSASWHPSGEFFVIGDYGYNWEGENVPSLLHFWSQEGKLIKSVYGSKAPYRNIAWNKEGSRLATASDVLRIWTNSGELMHESLQDSTNYLWGIDWSAGSDKIITASRFKSIALWDSTASLVKRIDIK